MTITNRVADLPEWFDLHYTEVKDSLVFWMMERVDKGYQPTEICDGPNLWRLRVGDRIAWVGDSRPDMVSENGVLMILECRECALAVSEASRTTPADLIAFGAITISGNNPGTVVACRNAMDMISRKGPPRRLSEHWALG